MIKQSTNTMSLNITRPSTTGDIVKKDLGRVKSYSSNQLIDRIKSITKSYKFDEKDKEIPNKSKEQEDIKTRFDIFKKTYLKPQQKKPKNASDQNQLGKGSKKKGD